MIMIMTMTMTNFFIIIFCLLTYIALAQASK
jgi:hypothetical protein